MTSTLPPRIQAASGSLGATLANATTYPLDLIVTRIQLSQHNKTYPGDIQTAKNIMNKTLRKEGISGFYSGLESDSVATMMSNFIYFYLYSFLRTSLLKRKSARSGVVDEKAKLTAMLSIPEELLIGLVSGIGSKVVTTPLSVVTVHLQTDKHEDDSDNVDLEKQSVETSSVEDKQSHIRRVIQRIYSESGLAGFWRGMSTTVILCANPALTMLFLQIYRRIFLHGKARERPSALQGFIGGALSNALAVTLLYPLILAKTRLQSRPDSKSKSALASVLIDIVDRHGLAALYQGLLAQVLKGFLNQGVTIMLKQSKKDLLLDSPYDLSASSSFDGKLAGLQTSCWPNASQDQDQTIYPIYSYGLGRVLSSKFLRFDADPVI
ncbi:mitochondrial carrier [Serendipita vermifera]|nr:mitochondrial carrier [Serendipita vermifera]